MAEKRNLPAIKDIYSESTDLVKHNDLNILLNQPPKQEWVKDHPLARNVKYIPIGRIEYLLTSIFVKWRVEILREGLLANSAYVVARVHYLDPVTNNWDWIDGLGACPIQTDKGAGATDWQQVKSDGVMKALPAAESYAVKDAVEKLGKLFGKDLNRADEIGYDNLIGRFDNIPEPDKKTLEEMNILLSEYTNYDELKSKAIKIKEDFMKKGLDEKLAYNIIKNRLDALK